MRRKFLLISFGFFLITSFSLLAQSQQGKWIYHLKITGTVDGLKGTGLINIFLPAAYSADKGKPSKLLIALHGWRQTLDAWEKNTRLTQIANKHGYVVVVPYMSTTTYEREYYKETMAQFKWGAIPGGRWVGEVILPYVRKHYHVYQTREKTGVFGLSTGGRGAALLAQYTREFKAFATLSGDYDIALLPRDFTIRAIYGPYEQFPARWKKDNCRYLLDRLKEVSALIIHGTRDRIAPVYQSQLFAKEMKNQGYDVEYIEDPKKGHDWTLWGGYLETVFRFFDRKLK